MNRNYFSGNRNGLFFNFLRFGILGILILGLCSSAMAANVYLHAVYVGETMADLEIRNAPPEYILYYKVYRDGDLLGQYNAGSEPIPIVQNGLIPYDEYEYVLYGYDKDGYEYNLHSRTITAAHISGHLHHSDSWSGASVNLGSLYILDGGDLDITHVTVNGGIFYIEGTGKISADFNATFNSVDLRFRNLSPLRGHSFQDTTFINGSITFQGDAYQLPSFGFTNCTFDNNPLDIYEPLDFSCRNSTFNGATHEVENINQYCIMENVTGNGAGFVLKSFHNVDCKNIHWKGGGYFNVSGFISTVEDSDFDRGIGISGDEINVSGVDIYNGYGSFTARDINLFTCNLTTATLTAHASERLVWSDSSFDAGNKSPRLDMKGTTITLENNQFHNAYIQIDYQKDYDTDMIVDNCTFDGYYGSSVRRSIDIKNDGSLKVTNSSFKDNRYGAIWFKPSYLSRGRGPVEIDNCSFYDYEGALLASDKIIIKNNSVRFADPAYSRMGFFIDSAVDVQITSNTIEGIGNAKGSIGALVRTSSLIFEDNVIKNMKDQGLIVGIDVNNLSVKRSRFEGCRIGVEFDESGGYPPCNRPPALFDSCHFIDCTEKSADIGIRTWLTFANCHFTGDVSEEHLFVDSRYSFPSDKWTTAGLELDHCEFIGGNRGIFAESRGWLNIHDCTFTNQGTAVYLKRIVPYCTFTNNSCTGAPVWIGETWDSSVSDNSFSNANSGLSAWNFSNSKILRNVFTDVARKALYVANAENTTIADNSIEKAGAGINGWSCSDSIFKNNTVFRCDAVDSDNAFIFEGCDHLTLSDNTATSCGRGFVMTECTDLTLDKCVAENNLDIGFLFTDESKSITLTDCQSKGNKIGLKTEKEEWLNSCEDIHIRSADPSKNTSSFSNNKEKGFWFLNAKNCSVTSIDCTNNKDYGVHVTDSSKGIRLNNLALSGSENLVTIDKSENVTVWNSTFKNASETGLLILEEANFNRIEGSTFQNMANGIDIYASVKNEVINNTLIACTGMGILIEGGESHTIKGNTIQKSKDTQIYIDGGRNHFLSDNKIANGEDYGLFAQKTTGLSCVNNLFLENESPALMEDGTNSGKIWNCAFRKNESGALYLMNCTGNQVENNSIIDNEEYGVLIENGANLIVAHNRITKCSRIGMELLTANGHTIYDNLFNNLHNVSDPGVNKWNIEPPVKQKNIIGGPWQGGNWWNNYMGEDTDGDGLGDTLIPHTDNAHIVNGGDEHPLFLSDGPTTFPIVINEICPPTTDTAKMRWLSSSRGKNDNSPVEWIEFYNSTNTDVSMVDWKLSICGGLYIYTIPVSAPDWDGVLEAYSYLVIHLQGTQDSPAEDLYWQDGARALSDSCVCITLLNPADLAVDFIRFGTGCDDAVCTSTTWLGPDPEKPVLGHTLARDSDSLDTNSGFDWDAMNGYDCDIPTPGTQNIEFSDRRNGFLLY